MEGQGNRWRNNNGNRRGGNNGNKRGGNNGNNRSGNTENKRGGYNGHNKSGNNENKRGGYNGHNKSGNNENKRGGNGENQRNYQYDNRRDDRNRSGSGNDHNVNQRQRNHREYQNRGPNDDNRTGNVPHYHRSGPSQNQNTQGNVQNHNRQHYQDNRNFNRRQNQVFIHQGNNVMVNNLSIQFNTLHLNNLVRQLNIPQVSGYNEPHTQYNQPLMHRTRHKRVDLHSLRKWENLTGNEEPDMRSGFIFTIMTYNVLAQGLLDQHPDLYREHNSANLNWEVRWPKLLQEIQTLKPDILCLQEVQESHVQAHFNTLSTLGYTGIYKKRTGVRIDGCAIYYKSNNLTLIEHTSVEYFQPSVKLLNRDNVALIAKFSPKFHPKNEFIVATTHLLYNPKREDVRMAQIQLLLTEIERLSYKNNGRQPSYLPVILTGDFNALPNSDLYQFVTRGTMIYNNLNTNLVDRRFQYPMLVTTNLGISDNCQHVELLDKRKNSTNLSRSDERDLIKLVNSDNRNSTMKVLNNSTFIPGKGVLTHKFNFKTAYDNQIGTTSQDGIWITVDYIFYSAQMNSSNKLKLLSRYKLPSRKDLENVKIPNESVGSDHLSLVGKFKLDL